MKLYELRGKNLFFASIFCNQLAVVYFITFFSLFGYAKELREKKLEGENFRPGALQNSKVSILPDVRFMTLKTEKSIKGTLAY
jgi:hypothetical protein